MTGNAASRMEAGGYEVELGPAVSRVGDVVLGNHPAVRRDSHADRVSVNP